MTSAARTGSSPLAIGRRRLTGWARSSLGVAHVVRRGTRRSRRRSTRRRRRPPRASGSRRRAWPRRASRRTAGGSSSTGAGAARRAPRAQASAPGDGRDATARSLGGRRVAGSTRSKRLPSPGSLSSSMWPPSAIASSLAIASPRPVPQPSRDQNGRKIRSCSAALDPRPGVGDGHRDAPVLGGELKLDPAAVGRPAERVREQVGDDLEHPVAVRDDHRPAVESQR